LNIHLSDQKHLKSRKYSENWSKFNLKKGHFGNRVFNDVCPICASKVNGRLNGLFAEGKKFDRYCSNCGWRGQNSNCIKDVKEVTFDKKFYLIIIVLSGLWLIIFLSDIFLFGSNHLFISVMIVCGIIALILLMNFEIFNN
jgi:hypothetical protein